MACSGTVAANEFLFVEFARGFKLDQIGLALGLEDFPFEQSQKSG